MFSSFNARAIGLTLSLSETMRLASVHGFGGVDVMVRDVLEEGVDLAAARREMDDRGLRPGAFPFPFDWRGDELAFRLSIRELSRHADAASALGLKRTGTWIIPETASAGGRPGAQEERVREMYAFHEERLGAIVEAFAPNGIVLGLEVIGVETSQSGDGWPFLHDLAGANELRRELELACNYPVGLLVDSWHLYAANEPIENALIAGADRVVWVHIADVPPGHSGERSTLNDAERGLPGESGIIPSGDLLSLLARHGYEGPVTAEPMAGCRSLAGLPAHVAAQRVADSFRGIWPASSFKR